MRSKGRKSKKKIFSITSGFRGAPNRLYRSAIQYGNHALAQAYTGRKLKKRTFRSLWITRLNAVAKQNGSKYSTFINSTKVNRIHINRKLLSQISCFDPMTTNSLMKML